MLLSKETVGGTLDFVSRLAVQTIDACDVASVSLVQDGAITTAGSSDDVAIEIDAIQYETGDGPCLDAIGKEAAWFQLDDMSKDRQWPAFSARATGKGIESLLAFTLELHDDTLGALNLFARRAGAFAEKDRETGAIYAAHVAVALANAQVHAKDEQLHGELEGILVSRQIIGQAQGILMEREFRTAEDALESLELRAAELRKKLGESAQEVIESADR